MYYYLLSIQGNLNATKKKKKGGKKERRADSNLKLKN
jgi:hypothetical protein